MVSLRLRGSDHKTQRKMVLSTVRSGKEEEEVRWMPGPEEQVNIFLLHVAIFSLHFKTTLFPMIFKNSVASCNSGDFLKQTRILPSPVCTKSGLTGTRHDDFVLETWYRLCAGELSLPWAP